MSGLARKLAATCLAAAAACWPACSSAPPRPYPAQWPAAAPAGRAEALVGTYLDPGLDDGQLPGTHSLVRSLVDQRETEADRVSLAVTPDGQLELAAWKAGERLAARRYPFAVADGWVIAERSWDDTGSGSGYLYQRERWLLAKAADGSLAAQLDYTVRGLFFVVPLWERHHTWIRFAQAASPP